MPRFHKKSDFCGLNPIFPINHPVIPMLYRYLPVNFLKIHENPPFYHQSDHGRRTLALGRVVQACTAIGLGHKGPTHRQADAELAHDLPQQWAGPRPGFFHMGKTWEYCRKFWPGIGLKKWIYIYIYIYIYMYIDSIW